MTGDELSSSVDVFRLKHADDLFMAGEPVGLLIPPKKR